MIMSTDDLRIDNLHLTQELQKSTDECRRLVNSLETKQKRLYARNDQLEELLRQHGVAVPDWPALEEGAV